MKYYILDLKTNLFLFGLNKRSLFFRTYSEAENLAKQMFKKHSDYHVLGIQIE